MLCLLFYFQCNFRLDNQCTSCGKWKSNLVLWWVHCLRTEQQWLGGNWVYLFLHILRKLGQSSKSRGSNLDELYCNFSVMEHVIAGIRCNNLLKSLKKVVTERHKVKGRGGKRGHSLYRDILFLVITAMGRENIDQSKKL